MPFLLHTAVKDTADGSLVLEEGTRHDTLEEARQTAQNLENTWTDPLRCEFSIHNEDTGEEEDVFT